MKLVMDVGNSRIKWGLVKDGRLEPGTSRERRESVAATMDAIWPAGDAPAAALISSVAGADFDAGLERWVLDHWGCRPAWFRSRPEALGVTNGYIDYGQLGSDRWAAILGARGRYPGPLGVIDAGTAVTLDVVDRGDRHLGGLIGPGLELAQRSLLTHTASIGKAAHRSTGTLGLSTAECVANGTVLGLAGALERWMSDLDRQLGGVDWIATGGSWPGISRIIARPVEYDPDLVLRGLARVLGT